MEVKVIEVTWKIIISTFNINLTRLTERQMDNQTQTLVALLQENFIDIIYLFLQRTGNVLSEGKLFYLKELKYFHLKIYFYKHNLCSFLPTS